MFNSDNISLRGREITMDKSKVFNVPMLCLSIFSYIFFMIILYFTSTIGFKNNILISLPLLMMIIIYVTQFINYKKQQ